MNLVRILRTHSDDVPAALARLRQPFALDPFRADPSTPASLVRDIIQQVAARGDDALIDLTARFDQVQLTADRLRVDPAELTAARQSLQPDLRQAIELAIENVRRFQQHILIRDPGPLCHDGVTLHSRPQPLGRVGVCVPGAAAPLPSTAVMTVVPAQVAGVPEIAIVAPPRHNGSIHPTILATASLLGVTEVYRVGGAQAVAALALGTKTIPAVDKIVGPGSIYTQLAKKLLFGLVDIDSFAGPSEVLIIADDSARPQAVAADMLAQAEHDPGLAILVTPSESLAQAVQPALVALSDPLPRRAALHHCLQQYCAIVLAKDLHEAADIANHFAPEHLQIATQQPEHLAEAIRTAGAIFLGHHTPEATGDYLAGPSHVLPTGGTARFFSALCANDFLRHTTIIRYEPHALARHSQAIIALARAEQLAAHALSVQVRNP